MKNLLYTLSLVALVACDSPGGGTANTSGARCDAADTCRRWLCICDVGTIDSASCTDRTCEDAPGVCAEACEAFGSSWSGDIAGSYLPGAQDPDATEPDPTEPDPTEPDPTGCDGFSCGNGQCIPADWRCDEAEDCSNGEDEYGCATGSCGPEDFTCNNGECLPGDWRCDGEDDCRNGDDEAGC